MDFREAQESLKAEGGIILIVVVVSPMFVYVKLVKLNTLSSTVYYVRYTSRKL